MTDLRGVQITTNAGTLEMEYQEDSGLAYSDQYTWFWKTDGVTRHWTRTWRNPWSRTSPV